MSHSHQMSAHYFLFALVFSQIQDDAVVFSGGQCVHLHSLDCSNNRIWWGLWSLVLPDCTSCVDPLRMSLFHRGWEKAVFIV